MESELESLRKQLAAKDRALDEALQELKLLSDYTPGTPEAEQQRLRVIEKLHAEVRVTWRGKWTALTTYWVDNKGSVINHNVVNKVHFVSS